MIEELRRAADDGRADAGRSRAGDGSTATPSAAGSPASAPALPTISGWAPCLVRVLVLVSLLIFTVPTFIAYLIAAMVLERRPEAMQASREEEAFWRSVRLEPSRTARDLARKFQDMERRLRAAEAKVTSSEYKLRRQFRDLERQP